jgi:Leucine-rich repeat (LRR) protein
MTVMLRDGWYSRSNSSIPFSSNNYLEGSIPEIYVERLEKLEYLMLQDNLLTGQLPENIGAWSHLTYVNLAQNKIGGHLPESLDELADLQLLYLQDNLLSGPLPSLKGMHAIGKL